MAWSYIQYPVMNHNGKCLKCVHTHTHTWITSLYSSKPTHQRPSPRSPAPESCSVSFLQKWKMFRKREQLGVISEEERDPPPPQKKINALCDSYQTRIICPTHSKPKAEMLKFAAEKRFIYNAAKQGDGKTKLKFTSLKMWVSWYLWDKEAGWSEVWWKVIGYKEKVK